MLCRDSPVDTKRFIKDADASISLRMIELIAFVLEHSCFREYGEAVGETLGDEELQADG